jgi:hypothetical protein
MMIPEERDKCYGCNKRWLQLEKPEDDASWIWMCAVYPDKAKHLQGCELKAERKVKGE